MKRQTTKISDRHGEKGAALIISILIATLLLAVAGTVILTSGMSATTSIEGTTELQAYYAAESGLEDALNVIRGHVAPHGIASITRMNFRNAVDPAKSNIPADPSTVGRLTAWLDYDSDDWRVTPTGGNYSYTVTVIDPDDPNGTTRNADASYRPKRIQVRSTGYGPNGSVKNMEAIIQKTYFDFDPNAMLVMRGSDANIAMSFDIGTSNAKFYTGHDNATPAVAALPTFGVTHANDKAVADDAITKGATVEEVSTQIVPIADLPEWLQTADKARTFLTDMQLVARSMGRYMTSLSGVAGTEASPKFTFVNGNANLDGGAGLLIVTGTLTLNGSPTFKGIILVLGDGKVLRDGGGSGDIWGSIYVARFARSWPSSENGLSHPFLAPTFHTDGAGTARLKYDSVWVQQGRDALGDIVRDIREY
ncbi:MAG TPA: pilus assembly PilX N-terminal domain-containing protein [Pyrinomonadaceae bacterium]|nr:pilus assembly PilX N-terminal domain-containing protein [Pyrinomonadaceae bacterium]